MQNPRLPNDKAAEPRYSNNFDPWISVAAGHQRAESRGPQGWRESRGMKLRSQFAASVLSGGGPRISDTVGMGSDNYDHKHKVLIPKEVKARAMNSVADMLRNPGTMKPTSSSTATTENLLPEKEGQENPNQNEGGGRPRKKIFDGLCIYINGSTFPHISDHKLKHVLTEHGARVSMHLGRRQVTHVILGKPAAAAGGYGGAGGGLMGGKLDREIKRVRGCAVKYVSVEWVMESIKAGKRLPESRFAELKIAPRNQKSVLGVFSSAKTDTDTEAVVRRSKMPPPLDDGS
ncbi:hypothetical protein QBC46DRAFT_424659 [Diplogelasinospora grovesii]|uniref:BRCT domain-containing protein n=1 Tax=Diplogelasinospora grovesii TaxID=303347 RepID=A0AAN6NHE5_9PEZI|nr:hypothetical protein QBC46DRAFT_424659 [Diplogelasinospora grovesii]